MIARDTFSFGGGSTAGSTITQAGGSDSNKGSLKMVAMVLGAGYIATKVLM